MVKVFVTTNDNRTYEGECLSEQFFPAWCQYVAEKGFQTKKVFIPITSIKAIELDGD